MVFLVIDNILLAPDMPESMLGQAVVRKFGLDAVPDVEIIRKSLDARKKDFINWRYRVRIQADEDLAAALLENSDVSMYREDPVPPVQKASGKKVVVIGAGPAGIFGALRLLRAGADVALIEKGRPVEQRILDVELLETDGILNPDSNVLFGEGGAGTFSDGKLTARSRRPQSAFFFREMVRHGADPEIIYNAKPHVGTDRLRIIMAAMRKTLIQEGCKVCFSSSVKELIIENGICRGVRYSEGTGSVKEILCDAVLLACGHSSDLYEKLYDQGVSMESKATAMGVRVEHPAELIRDIQYGKSKYRDILPAAEYLVTFNNKRTGRGTYSFCMCPGGSVINSSADQGRLCVNGMSSSGRTGNFSNAAIVVTVDPSDFGPHPLAGLEFRRKIETLAFKAGGPGFTAPAQRITSFLAGKKDRSLPESSYRPGTRPGNIRSYLPDFIVDELCTAFRSFDRKMKGFVSEEALIIGAETGTSSSVRILRTKDFESVSVPGLFPAGEGAGYAGGIVSSATDGICCADSIIEKIRGKD